MTIASQLPKDYDITIVGKHLPGDEADMKSKEWASPWAAAIWLGTHSHLSSSREQRLQLESLVGLMDIAEKHPESSVRKIQIREIMDNGSPEQVWYQHKVPGFRFLNKDEIPRESKFGMTYETVVITPPVFLTWMRAKLEKRGVEFKKVSVGSLAELKGMGHDVLINASGIGSATLTDVQDTKVKPVRLQSCIIKHPAYRQAYARRGDNYYTTAFSHLDGEVYVGGIIEYGNDDTNAYDDGRQMVGQDLSMKIAWLTLSRSLTVSTKTTLLSSLPTTLQPPGSIETMLHGTRHVRLRMGESGSKDSFWETNKSFMPTVSMRVATHIATGLLGRLPDLCRKSCRTRRFCYQRFESARLVYIGASY